MPILCAAADARYVPAQLSGYRRRRSRPTRLRQATGDCSSGSAERMTDRAMRLVGREGLAGRDPRGPARLTRKISRAPLSPSVWMTVTLLECAHCHQVEIKRA